MPNNKPTRKYFATNLLVSSILAGVTGFWGWVLGFILRFAINYLAKEGVYFIDITLVNIRTNMQEDEWIKVAGDAWEKVEQGGMTDAQGKDLDDKFKKAFDNFTVFSKVRNG